jgi:hypothetical protein
MNEASFLTTGSAALRLRVLPHHVVRILDRGMAPHQRVGRVRLIALGDLPLLREALVAAGYLHEQPGAQAVAVT